MQETDGVKSEDKGNTIIVLGRRKRGGGGIVGNGLDLAVNRVNHGGWESLVEGKGVHTGDNPVEGRVMRTGAAEKQDKCNRVLLVAGYEEV
eukprot:g29398.t1